jgi:hypothetical protein
MQLQGSAAMMVQSQSLRACGASACVSASSLVGLALRLLAAVLGSQFRSEWLSASLASLTRPLSLALFWHASMYAPTRPRQGSSIFFSVLFSSNCVLSSILFRCVVHELHVVRSRLLFGIVRSHLCLISCALLWRKLDGVISSIVSFFFQSRALLSALCSLSGVSPVPCEFSSESSSASSSASLRFSLSASSTARRSSSSFSSLAIRFRSSLSACFLAIFSYFAFCKFSSVTFSTACSTFLAVLHITSFCPSPVSSMRFLMTAMT